MLRMFTVIERCHEKICFCIWENKGSGQLRGNHATDQRLCLSYLVQYFTLTFQEVEVVGVQITCQRDSCLPMREGRHSATWRELPRRDS